MEGLLWFSALILGGIAIGCVEQYYEKKAEYRRELFKDLTAQLNNHNWYYNKTFNQCMYELAKNMEFTSARLLALSQDSHTTKSDALEIALRAATDRQAEYMRMASEYWKMYYHNLFLEHKHSKEDADSFRSALLASPRVVDEKIKDISRHSLETIADILNKCDSASQNAPIEEMPTEND